MADGEFSEQTKRILAKRANEKCSICARQTSKPHSIDAAAFLNLGEAAHIKGNKPGPHTRFDSGMTNAKRSDISNGIWLCTFCHKEIDSDCDKFTVEYLKEIKQQHENKVRLEEFHIHWNEYVQMKNQIHNLENLIQEKEKNQSLNEIIYNSQLTELKIELQKIKTEKERVETAFEHIKATISGFDLSTGLSRINKILELIRKGDIEIASKELTEEMLSEQETEVARKRMLKGNLLELERDYSGAEFQYSKAYELSSKPMFLENYISFLKRARKIQKAIAICLEVLKTATNEHTLIWTNGALGQMFSSENNNAMAIKYLSAAKNEIEKKLPTDDGKLKLQRAKMHNGLGIAYSHVGDFDNAIENFELSLNAFWEMSVQDGITHVKELGNLYNNIAKVYLENSSLDEAIFYFSKAQFAFEDEPLDEMSLAILYINITDVYTHQKRYDLQKARGFVDRARDILVRQFAKDPLKYLEYYLAITIKSGDINLALGNLSIAETEYTSVFKLSDEFKEQYNIFYRSTIVTAYSNYGMMHRFTGQYEIANKYIDLAINLLNQFDDQEHSKHFNLAKLYVVKAEMCKEKIKKLEFLDVALTNIQRCSDKTFAKVWKIIIDNNIKSVLAEE